MISVSVPGRRCGSRRRRLPSWSSRWKPEGRKRRQACVHVGAPGFFGQSAQSRVQRSPRAYREGDAAPRDGECPVGAVALGLAGGTWAGAGRRHRSTKQLRSGSIGLITTQMPGMPGRWQSATLGRAAAAGRFVRRPVRADSANPALCFSRRQAPSPRPGTLVGG